MTDQCGIRESDDMVDHLTDTISSFDASVEDIINPVTFILADLLAQYTDGEYDPNVALLAADQLARCYKFVCSSDEEPDNITIQ